MDSRYNLKEVERVNNYPHKVNDKPIVSVAVVTYNQFDFIAQCLDGILMQKTDFFFEILLGEDASNDGTREICIEYAEKHPSKIRLFLHSRENNIIINGKPSGRFNMLYNLSKAQGKYIALCEGDDYWTDPLKLQKQVDFLEANPECSLCFHNANLVYEDQDKNNGLFASYGKSDYYPVDILNEWLIPTASVVCRNVISSPRFFDFIYKMPVGDLPLFVYLGEYGKFKCINEVMSVYRVLSTGIVQRELQSEKYYIMSKELSADLLNYFKPKHQDILNVRIAFDNYYLARILARKGKRKKAIGFLVSSLIADPFIFFRNRNKYKYITLRRLLPKILFDILRGKKTIVIDD